MQYIKNATTFIFPVRVQLKVTINLIFLAVSF